MFCVLNLEYIFYVNFLHSIDTKLRGKEKWKYGLKLIITSPPHNRAMCGQCMHFQTHTYAC